MSNVYLSAYRVCDRSIDGSSLTVYKADGWLSPDRYDQDDIISDLKDRGVSNYDLQVISNHEMIINDGVVIISSRQTECGDRQKVNCLKRLVDVLS